MRIIHLSDIHLSSDNIKELKLHYLNSLITDLKDINREKEIDLIIISGDLLDKGGDSLLTLLDQSFHNNPYDIFEKEFITPICNKLPFIKEKIIFIPGNHDIERAKIDEVIEAGLISLCSNPKKTNDLYTKYVTTPEKIGIDRIEKYLEFEKKYHDNNKSLQYITSILESKVIYKYDGENIGIALINDSWRCSVGEIQNHYIGTNQFHNCLNFFNENKTVFNIAVMHHPLKCLNKHEEKTIDDILHNLSFEILLLGHEHEKKVQQSNSGNNKSILFIRGRSAFDKPHENHTDYVSGYTYIDIDLKKKNISCNFKKYDKNNFRFENEIEYGTSKKEFAYGISERQTKEVNHIKEKFINDFDKKKFINIFKNED